MDTIDLSKAKVGDKFRTRNGGVVTYKGTDGRIAKSRSDYYVCACSDDAKITYFENGALLLDEEHPYDLVEQVFDDEKDTTDLEIVGAMNKAIKEIPEKAAEREKDLQRRQEVVELAEKMYIMFEAENFKYYLCNNGNNAFESKELVGIALVGASSFIDKKHQYLNEGKL